MNAQSIAIIEASVAYAGIKHHMPNRLHTLGATVFRIGISEPSKYSYVHGCGYIDTRLSQPFTILAAHAFLANQLVLVATVDRS